MLSTNNKPIPIVPKVNLDKEKYTSLSVMKEGRAKMECNACNSGNAEAI